VTRASARSKGDADSTLAIQFDRAVLKDGHEVPLQVTIQALASDQRAAAVNPDELQPAGNIEAGAAGAGTAGNRGVVGGVGSTVGGAASGAASTVPRTVQDQTGAVNSTVGGASQCCGPNAGRFDCVRRVDTDEPRRLRDQWFKPQQQCRELDGRIGDYFRRQECAA